MVYEAAKDVDNMVVQVVSKENIFPSSPTPDHLRTYKLSVLDQTQLGVYVGMTLFYINHETSNLDSFISGRSKRLKQALSDTLDKFYPFAGKVIDDFHVDCNDEGVYYIETRVNTSLSDFLSQSPGDESIRKLVPQNVTESPFGNYVLIIQVNIFSCGGMAICTSINHKIIDGDTYALFLRHWTAATRGSSDTVNPSFVGPSLFPQIPSLQYVSPIPVGKIKFVTQRFVFDGPSIAALKAKTKSSLPGIEATRFEAVAALLWKCAAKAAHEVGNSSVDKPYDLGIIISLRGKNCVPKNAIGNLFMGWVARGNLGTENEHHYLVNSIKKCKAEINDTFVEVIKGDAGTPVILKMAETIMNTGASPDLWISSVCNMGVYELDFGWGTPIWFYYSNISVANVVALCETRAGGGFEAVVSLTNNEMAIFEKDPELLAYVSSNPAPL